MRAPRRPRRLRCERSRQLRLAPIPVTADATPSAPPALPTAAPAPAMARWEGTPWRANDDGLRLVRQIVCLGRKVLLKRKWHGLGGGRQQSGTATRGYGHTQH